jgi:hypothetical protein
MRLTKSMMAATTSVPEIASDAANVLHLALVTSSDSRLIRNGAELRVKTAAGGRLSLPRLAVTHAAKDAPRALAARCNFNKFI